MKQALSFIAFILLFVNSGKSQTLHRLIGQVDTSAGFDLGDTLVYRYDTTFYRYPGNSLQYDTCQSATFNGAFFVWRQLSREFDNNGHLVNLVISYKWNIYDPWYIWNREVYFYDAAGRNIAIHNEEPTTQNPSGWYLKGTSNFIYDSNNNIIEEIDSADLAGLTDAMRLSYVYDAGNNMLEQLMCLKNFSTVPPSWDSTRTTNTYSGNLLLTTTVTGRSIYDSLWQLFSTDTNRYNGNNMVRHLSYDASGVLQQTDSFIYDNANRVVRVERIGGLRDSLFYDQNNNLVRRLTKIKLSGKPMKNVKQYRATYNALNLLSIAINEAWADSNKRWYPGTDGQYYQHLYYENEPTSVNTNNLQLSALTLSPNPASSFLTIDAKWNTPESAEITISGMNGNTVMQWPETATKELHKMIPLSSLAPGNYVLSVKGKSGRESRVFTVVKTN